MKIKIFDRLFAYEIYLQHNSQEFIDLIESLSWVFYDKPWLRRWRFPKCKLKDFLLLLKGKNVVVFVGGRRNGGFREKIIIPNDTIEVKFNDNEEVMIRVFDSEIIKSYSTTIVKLIEEKYFIVKSSEFFFALHTFFLKKNIRLHII